MNIRFSGTPVANVSPRVHLFFKRIFPLCFVLVGCALLISGGKNIVNAQASKKWPTVQGQITYSQVQELYKNRSNTIPSRRQSRSDLSYQARITYHYEVDGKAYDNSRVYHGDNHSTRDHRRAEHWVRKYPVGREVVVRYSPKGPQSSVLEPGAHSALWQQFWGGFLFIFCGGLWALIFPKVIDRALQKAA